MLILAEEPNEKLPTNLGQHGRTYAFLSHPRSATHPHIEWMEKSQSSGGRGGTERPQSEAVIRERHAVAQVRPSLDGERPVSWLWMSWIRWRISTVWRGRGCTNTVTDSQQHSQILQFGSEQHVLRSKRISWPTIPPGKTDRRSLCYTLVSRVSRVESCSVYYTPSFSPPCCLSPLRRLVNFRMVGTAIARSLAQWPVGFSFSFRRLEITQLLSRKMPVIYCYLQPICSRDSPSNNCKSIDRLAFGDLVDISCATNGISWWARGVEGQCCVGSRQ